MVRSLIAMTVALLTFAAPALADPGDPVVEYGDGGVVQIPPEFDVFVAPGELVVRPDGGAVIDAGYGDIDPIFSGVVVDPTGSWSRFAGPAMCSAELAAPAGDGSLFFAGDCENGSFAIRFTADLTLDPDWGDPGEPGVFWDDEIGGMTVLGIDGETVLYLTGPWDDRTLLARDFAGTLIGTLPIDGTNPELAGPLAVFPGEEDGYLLAGLLASWDQIGVATGELGGTATLLGTIPLAGEVGAFDSVLGRHGSLIVAYTTEAIDQHHLHLLRIGDDGHHDPDLTDPNLAITLDPEGHTQVAVAELRTGEIAVVVTDGRGHTQIDRFTATGQHLGRLVGPDAFSPGLSRFLDLGVSPVDGHILVSRDVHDWETSVAQIVRFEGDASGRFVDDDGSVFATDVEWAAAEEITRGCNPPANDMFCPNDPVTRGQLAAFLVRAFDLTDRGTTDPFGDDDGSIFEADIEKLATAGITKGCNPPINDQFCPNAEVTRGQLAAFLVRALGLTDRGSTDFVDDDGSVFEADIEKLAAAGITRGCNPPANDMFCPDEPVTRGQLAAFLHRALD